MPLNPYAQHLIRLVAVPAVVLGLSACGSGEARKVAVATTTTAVTAARVAPASLARPSSPVMLTLSGAIAHPNVGATAQTDRAGIEALGVQTVSLYEPFRKRRMGFRAVPLKRVVDAAGATGKQLHATALNDYVVDLPTSVAREAGVYLATRNADGSSIAIEDGGPIRIVFAHGARHADNENFWIWSLARIEVR